MTDIKCKFCGDYLFSCGHLMNGMLKPCGTVAAYRRHLRAGELPCDRCTLANSRYRIGERKRRKVMPARELAPCGTRAAYDRHMRKGEPSCQPCRDARQVYKRARQQERRRIREALTWLSPWQADAFMAGRWL